ncbi:STAS domain-containing protein [Virgisporangium aurantiacum]|uniref:Anti-sigma factor antagonist n=1 Tax=Virgisporangium aurantiacum TaxID=175570 RepID=A0A8J3ZDY1_9ACTN|nr:STAS domain-containing protein [Virgisporangium aurantiacum]GIJ62146.1 anti-sigma factor antagonist [Virgisporangium aurantiacum]
MDSAVVTASGELDMESADELRDGLADAIAADPRRLVIDLSDVTFVDSTILGVLVGARSRLGRNSGRIHLVISNPFVLRLFHLTGLDQVFAIHSTRGQALPPA